MIRALSLLVALAPLAACGSAPDKAATNQTADSTDYLKRMAELNENERDGVLLRAIRDADRPCQGVQRSVPAPAVEGGPPAWVATCEDGGEWLVAVGAVGGLVLRVPLVALCTDNGAMVAALGAQVLRDGGAASGMDLAADPGLPAAVVHVPA